MNGLTLKCILEASHAQHESFVQSRPIFRLFAIRFTLQFKKHGIRMAIEDVQQCFRKMPRRSEGSKIENLSRTINSSIALNVSMEPTFPNLSTLILLEIYVFPKTQPRCSQFHDKYDFELSHPFPLHVHSSLHALLSPRTKWLGIY